MQELRLVSVKSESRTVFPFQDLFEKWSKPNRKIYRSYKQFNSEGFKKDLEFRLNHLTSSSYDDFETTFLKELNRHAPLKKKILRQ